MKLGYEIRRKDSGSFEYRDYDNLPSDDMILQYANEIVQEYVKKYNERNSYSVFFTPLFLTDIKKVIVREWDNEKKTFRRKGYKKILIPSKTTATYKNGSRDVFVKFLPKD